MQLQAFLHIEPPSRNNHTMADIDDADKLLDLNPWLEGGDYFRYTGSTTHPPCDETPVMFVKRDPIKASDRQLKVLHDMLFKLNLGWGNYRSVMPFNNRVLTAMNTKRGDPPLKPDVYNVPSGGTNPITQRELTAMRWSRQALRIAEQATAHAKELDERMRAAADAHLNAQQSDVVDRAPPGFNIKYGASTDPTNTEVMQKLIKQEGSNAATANSFDIHGDVSAAVRQAASEYLGKAQDVAESFAAPSPAPAL